MRVMGLDPSCTATGVVTLEQWEANELRPMIQCQKTLKVRDAPDNLTRACMQVSELDEILEEMKPRLVVIEGYAFAGNKGNMVPLAELGTCLRLALRRRDIPYLECAPTTLKKFILGKGVGKKDQMRLETYKRWKFEHDDHDVIDAFGLAMIGMAAVTEVGFPGTHEMKLTLKMCEAAQTLVKNVDLLKLIG